MKLLNYSSCTWNQKKMVKHCLHFLQENPATGTQNENKKSSYSLRHRRKAVLLKGLSPNDKEMLTVKH